MSPLGGGFKFRAQNKKYGIKVVLMLFKFYFGNFQFCGNY